MVTGGDLEENASLRRWETLRNLSDAVHYAARRSDAMRRLEHELGQ